MKKNNDILISYWFIIALTILLLNDFLWKGLYGNWLTGKISDFAGLFIFPLFWTVLFPLHKTKIFVLTSLFFIFWKSMYSQPFIDLWNGIGILNIYRIVDYSDLLALLILPIAYTIDSKKEKIKALKISHLAILLVSAFSFMATSYDTDVPINKSYSFSCSKDVLVAKLNKINNLNHGYDRKFIAQNPVDTIGLTIPSSFCFTNFEAKIAVSNMGQNTHLSLIEAHHRCPKSRKDKDKLIQEFEKMIIDKLNDNLSK